MRKITQGEDNRSVQFLYVLSACSMRVKSVYFAHFSRAPNVLGCSLWHDVDQGASVSGKGSSVWHNEQGSF